ncbi:MAG: ATP-binding cassette domain-containing protein [Planctomycetes bacterium]|nr:ATP-binding cassette domain-containing protein [Planctomycetota bacterium]
MIRVSGLRKTFGAVVAVDDISFTVREGEVVGFLGPNGAGKSTPMRMLTTYLDPDAGAIEIAGIDVLERPLEARRRLGYLPESAPLYEELGVVESLKFTARVRGLPAAARRARIAEMIAACGLEDVVRKDVSQLSRGYRQRLGLAQTLLHDPDFLILDEPTSGLDPNQIKEMRGLIQRIGETKTIILSTHILSEVQATCTRALIINEGRIVADDRPDNLVAASPAAEGARFVLVLRGAAPEAACAVLARLPGVSHASGTAQGDGLTRLEVQGSGAGLGEELFQAAVREKWLLSELRQERASLEEVFGRLTKGAQP